MLGVATILQIAAAAAQEARDLAARLSAGTRLEIEAVAN